MASLVRRYWSILYPRAVPKSSGAIRLGLLGASNIAPAAVINPARSHPDLIIAAVAARDNTKATTYAKKYGIAKVHTAYQDLLDDETIDAVYIALPNGLHFEWSIKALKAGKHVLLEKPYTSNAVEAKALHEFHMSLPEPRPVILEAFHNQFHPVWDTFMSFITPDKVESAISSLHLFKGMFSYDDIRFNYDLGGGSLMDLGTYTVACIRKIFQTEPVECVTTTARIVPEPWNQNVDASMRAEWKFSNGGTGTIDIDLAKTGLLPFKSVTQNWPSMTTPMTKVIHRESVVSDQADQEKWGPDQVHSVIRTVTIWNIIGPYLWHRIDIKDEHILRKAENETIVKRWETNEMVKAYSWGPLANKEGTTRTGEEWWTTYRYMVEEFVNRIKGRQGSGIWVDGEDSIKQMAMIDSAYVKAGLPLRPTSTYI